MKNKRVFLFTRKWTALILALGLALSLSACGSSAPETASEETASEETASEETASEEKSSEEAEETGAEAVPLDTSEENTIRFADNPGTIRYAVIILASKLGYYEEEGVNVEFVTAQDNTAALTAISTNKAELDVVGTGIVPDLAFINSGSDLCIFEGTAAEGGSIISRPEDVEKYKDLKNYGGTTVVMVRNSSSWVITRKLLMDEGVDLDSITVKEVDSQADVAQAVAKGEADTGYLPTEFARSFEEIGEEIVYEVGDLSPQYVCCRQVTSREKLETKHDAFVKYTKANLRAWKYFEDESNREEVNRLLAEFSGQTEEYVDDYLFVNKVVLTLDPNRKGVNEFYDSLADTGYFENADVDINENIDTEVYKEALDEILEEYPDDPFYQEALELYNTYNT